MILPTRMLGSTGLATSVLGYGAMELRGSRIWNGRPISDRQAEVVLNTVLEAGINFIDTANDYGRSEELIGRFISHRKDEFILSSKCGCQVRRRDESTDATPHVWTRANLVRGVDESLARLKLDCIDIMQLHNPSVEDCEQGELVEVLQDLKKDGRIRWLGCSSTLPHILTFIEWGVFDVFQVPYSALQREHEQVLTYAAMAGAGVIVRGGVARGEPGAGLGDGEKWQIYADAELDDLRENGESRTQFLLRFLLANPDLSTTIVGTMNPQHVQENVQAVLGGPLDPQIYAEARRRLQATGERPVEIETYIKASKKGP